MNKDFTQEKLNSFTSEKKMRILLDLASYIESNSLSIESNSFKKLTKYHAFLEDDPDQNIQKLNKEFSKVVNIDYQFQVYLMNLERLLGQSSKEYQFMVQMKDSVDPIANVSKTFPIICILDSVRSAHNVGAMIRTSECFGVEKLFTGGLTPTVKSPHVQKTAMGCEKNISIEHRDDVIELIKELKEEGYEIWAIETSRESTNLNQLKTAPKKLALVFGHEQFGVSAKVLKLSDKLVPIKLFGLKNSLNVSISHGIVLNKITELQDS